MGLKAVSYPHREYGQFEQPGAPWYFGDLGTRFELAPPVLGEHTVEILTDLGFSPTEIHSLLDSNTARAYPPDLLVLALQDTT